VGIHFGFASWVFGLAGGRVGGGGVAAVNRLMAALVVAILLVMGIPILVLMVDLVWAAWD
jgi:hypothetical protein